MKRLGPLESDIDKKIKSGKSIAEYIESNRKNHKGTEVQEKIFASELFIYEIQKDISEQRELLATHKATKCIKNSIQEYHSEMESILNLIYELRHQKYLIDEFTKTKVNLIIEKINSMFSLALFKFFDAILRITRLKRRMKLWLIV